MRRAFIPVLLLALLVSLAGCQKSPDAAAAAYERLLSGDLTLFDKAEIETWALDTWMELVLVPGEAEYTCLDLDGDGTQELLLQRTGDPGGYNGVFHYRDGKLFCWQNDGMEGSCRDYPLRDGTMVRQYDHMNTRSYTLFRYREDGSAEITGELFAREGPSPLSSLDPSPFYQIDGEAVDQSVFQEKLDTLVTSQQLDPSAWTVL